MSRILIVDYGMANLRSVQKAFEKVGHAATITADPNDLTAADKLVLPGVGAFQDAIAHLRESGWVAPIAEHIHADRPFLGICLGLELLFDRSYEDGEHAGLGLIAGDVVRFTDQPGLPVPHMGWNQLRARRPSTLLDGMADDSHVYFVHSYYGVPTDADWVLADADYPGPFAAALGRGRVFATQFHPEKSQQVGLRMIQNFATS